MECKLERELSQDVITKETTEKVLEIVRRELKFLIKHNILMTPRNFSNWFKVFCYLVENNKNLSDVEIFSLYEEYINDKINLTDGQVVNIPNRKEIADTLEKIAEAIDEKLIEAIGVIYFHQENIDTHTKNIQKNVEKLEAKDKFQKILEELSILRSQNESLMQKLEEYHKEITKLNTEIKIAKEEANGDFLTGLVNRRSFERSVKDLLKEVKEKDYTFSLIIMDIDNFKYVNDTYGHLAGDEVLKEIAMLLRIFLRANTIIGRLGGEEFGIILPNVNIENAVKVAERLRNAIENREIKFNNHIIKVTASFGVTETKKTDDYISLFERADKALYKAKNNGKNRIEIIL
ncbi:MAG: GGDEF domain-containing protein [Hydrogenothermaceae bacterium]|nr:GGDEF domain-containing protein [Hydrogenothermaceae bacterium]